MFYTRSLKYYNMIPTSRLSRGIAHIIEVYLTPKLLRDIADRRRGNEGSRRITRKHREYIKDYISYLRLALLWLKSRNALAILILAYGLEVAGHILATIKISPL
jgi:hypothetical protein